MTLVAMSFCPEHVRCPCCLSWWMPAFRPLCPACGAALGEGTVSGAVVQPGAQPSPGEKGWPEGPPGEAGTLAGRARRPRGSEDVLSLCWCPLAPSQ